MEIRRLTPDDAAAYRALRLRGLREHPEAFTSSHEEEDAQPLAWSAQRLASGSTSFWGALGAGALCGVVGLDRERKAKNRHKAHVVGMYVPPEHAGCGVGMALLDALVAHARAEGLRLLVLTATQGNSRACKLYERAGFRSFGVEPRAVRVGGRFWGKNHMFLELDPS